MGAFEPVCSYVSPFALTNGNPIGGTYSGPGVGVGNGIFNPALVGAGPEIITYSYTDTNGCTNTAEEALIVEDCAAVGSLTDVHFTIYPNPSSGYFTISSATMNIEHIKVYDGAGKLISEQQFKGMQEIGLDLQSLADGMYHAEISSGAVTERVQLIVNK